MTQKNTAGKPIILQLLDWLEQNVLALLPGLLEVMRHPSVAAARAESNLLGYMVEKKQPAGTGKQYHKRGNGPAKKKEAAPVTRPVVAKVPLETAPKATQKQKQPSPSLPAQPYEQQKVQQQSQQKQREVQAQTGLSTAPDFVFDHGRSSQQKQSRQYHPLKSQKDFARAAKEEERRSEARVRRAEEEGERLRVAFERQTRTKAYQKMLRARQELPAMQMRVKVERAVEEHQVVVISGATGCGKSTQVPQFLLDYLLRRGSGHSAGIICTQPRRLAAIGVAERVAQERADSCGGQVGYQIRLEQKRGPETRLLFCTTGILLRALQGDPLLEGFFRSEGHGADGIGRVTHIIVDEVHERNMDSDFLMIILRDLLPRRPDLKLVLMSATLNANLFAEYFMVISAPLSSASIACPFVIYLLLSFYLFCSLSKLCSIACMINFSPTGWFT